MASDITDKPETQETNDTKRRWLSPAAFLIPMMLMLMGMVGWSIDAGASATVAAQEAKKDAANVAEELHVHAARQNGSFETIDNKLGTLTKKFDTVDDKFDTLTGKFDTSWGHHGDSRKSFETLSTELKSLRDLVIASGLRQQPDSTP